MNREANIQVTETEDKRIVALSGQAIADYHTIIFEIQEISEQTLTKQQAEGFMHCLLDVFFCHSEDVFELEDRIAEVAEVLTRFAERLKAV